MILKTFDLDKVDLKKKSFYLFYGQNQGHKDELINKKFKKIFLEKTYYYEESEILANIDNFFDNILSKSFFENEKLIIVNRATDKLTNIIKEILEKKKDDIVIILKAKKKKKKSKLRTFFEKSKSAICVPFYEDNNQTLSLIVNQCFRKYKIPISQQSINLIVERCRGDRQNLSNELDKIQNFMMDKKNIEIDDILKLTNLAENYNVSQLIDSCLSKNKKRTVNILNENNYSLEDCILIIRTFLIKSKRLFKLCKNFQETKNLDTAISNFKPPIFWKDKDIVKQQMKNWSYKDVENLTYEINEIELLIKKYSNNSIIILSNFIIEKASSINN